MKKIDKKYIIILLMFSLSLSLFGTMFFDDVFFDLKNGEYILKHGIDLMDHFSSITGLRYLYTHFLYDIVLYIIYALSREIGIKIFFTVVYTSLFYLLFREYDKKINNGLISFVLSFLVMLWMAPYLSNRVQSVTYVLFLLEIIFVEKLYSEDSKIARYMIPILSLIIVNVHMPLWFFTLILFLPYIANLLFDKLEIIKLKKNECKNKISFIIVFLITILCGFVNVGTYESFTFPFITIGTHEYDFVSEMKPLNVMNEKLYLVFVIAALIIFIIPKIKLKIKDICMIVGISLMPFMAVRNISYFYMIVPLFLVGILADNNIKLKEIKINEKISKYAYIFIIVFSVFSIVSYDFTGTSFDIRKKKINSSINYITSKYDVTNMKLYNDIDNGSYLLFKGIPVCVDTRLEVYALTYNKRESVLDNYNNMNPIEFSEQYGLNYILINNLDSDYDLVANSSDWLLDYQDETYSLYVKNDNICHDPLKE